MRLVKTRRQDINRLAFAPDSRGLLAVGCREAVLWRDVMSDAAPLRYSNSYVMDALLDSTGCYLITSTTTGVHVHDLTGSGRIAEIHLERPELDEGFSVFSTSPTEPVFLVHQLNESLSSWRIVPDGGLTRLWTQAVDDCSRHAEFLRDGATIVNGEYRGWNAAHLWLVFRQAETGTVIRQVQVPETECPVERIVVSPDGQWIGHNLNTRLWIRESGGDSRIVAGVVNSTAKWYTDLAFHPSGRYLAATSNDTMVKLYDTASWQEAKSFTWAIGRLKSVAFSPDGTLAVAGSDTGRVVVWDLDL